MYRRNISSLNPEFSIWHESDSISKVFFSIKAKELLYSKKENETGFMTKVKLQYKLYDSYETDIIIDSSTIYITDVCKENGISFSGKTEIAGDFSFQPPKGKTSLLEILTTDVYRNQFDVKYIHINKLNSLGEQNFLVKPVRTERPLLRKNLLMNEAAYIRHADTAIMRLTGRYYNREFSIAPPPFSASGPVHFDFQADSIFALMADSTGRMVFEMKKEGMYHFVADSTQKEGLTLFYFGETFPELGAAEELVPPLRYITTKKEFSEITSSGNMKEAVDKFWLDIGISPERSKELIRQYYNRVQDANRFFTSYREGWKTDRGMIYIVFGPPNAVYKSFETENWLYGEENNFMSVSFNFRKFQNPFTDNEFMLERSPVYKANYFKAVDTWREGRVFTTN